MKVKSYLNLTHIKRRITGVALSNSLGSYEGFVSHEFKSLHRVKVINFASHFS